MFLAREPARGPAITKPRSENDFACWRVASPKHNAGYCSMDVVRILIAILIPPLGVFLQVGLGLQFWLNILLTILGYVPGIIHAIWVIMRR